MRYQRRPPAGCPDQQLDLRRIVPRQLPFGSSHLGTRGLNLYGYPGWRRNAGQALPGSWRRNHDQH